MKPCDTCLAIGTETCEGCTVKQTHIQNAALCAALSMCSERFLEIEKYAKEQSERDRKELGQYQCIQTTKDVDSATAINQHTARLKDEAAEIARQAHDMAEFCEKLTQVEIVED